MKIVGSGNDVFFEGTVPPSPHSDSPDTTGLFEIGGDGLGTLDPTSEKLVDALSRGSLVGFWEGPNEDFATPITFAAFDLSGSAKAISEWRECILGK